MRARAVVLAIAIVMAPLGAQAADLVVRWEEGYNPEEDAAAREIIAAFEHKTGKRVALVFQVQAALATPGSHHCTPLTAYTRVSRETRSCAQPCRSDWR